MMNQSSTLAILMSLAAGLAAQSIATIAGTGSIGFSGDNGPAALAMVNHPRGMAVDSAGNIYIADLDNARIRKVNLNGNITTVAGTGVIGYSGDGGPALNAMLNGPQAVALDASGNLLIADTQNRRLRRVDAFGVITTIAGTGTEGFSGDGGLATQAMLHQAVDLAVDTAGNIYFADSTDSRVRKIATNGIITTVAGNGNPGYSGDGNQAIASQINFPVSIALDASNNLYIADGNNFRIRMVTASTGLISTFAGSGTAGFSGDGGPATSATINYAYGVRVDSQNHVFIADTSNNRIRSVVNGTVFTLAGNGVDGFSGDGGAAASAQFSFPWSLALDTSGNLLIGDRVNDRIRKVIFTSSAGPSISQNSVVNAASYAPAGSANGAIAPGSIVAIFGSNLASSAAAATSVPLPTVLADTSVTMNGTPVPLFYVANGQVNAQAPFGLAAGSVQVQVSRGSQTTASQPIQVVPVSPGIFTLNAQGSGDGAFLHASFAPVNVGNPAVAGETILIYCTGLGATSPAATTGAATPSNQLYSSVITPTVTIGGKSSVISFAGLAPGFVALYQINAQIPAGLPSGSQQVVIQMNGVLSNIVTIRSN